MKYSFIENKNFNKENYLLLTYELHRADHAVRPETKASFEYDMLLSPCSTSWSAFFYNNRWNMLKKSFRTWKSKCQLCTESISRVK